MTTIRSPAKLIHLDHTLLLATAAKVCLSRPGAVAVVLRDTGRQAAHSVNELGWSRRGMEALWRNCPVNALDDFARPLVRVEAYLAFLEGHTYCDRCGDRVRPGRMHKQPGGRRRDTPRVTK
jgi:hypothetical protein